MWHFISLGNTDVRSFLTTINYVISFLFFFRKAMIERTEQSEFETEMKPAIQAQPKSWPSTKLSSQNRSWKPCVVLLEFNWRTQHLIGAVHEGILWFRPSSSLSIIGFPSSMGEGQRYSERLIERKIIALLKVTSYRFIVLENLLIVVSFLPFCSICSVCSCFCTENEQSSYFLCYWN